MDSRLLSEEVEDLREICKEICSEKNLVEEGTRACSTHHTTSGSRKEALTAILQLIKFYLSLIAQTMGLSPNSYSEPKISTLAFVIWRAVSFYSRQNIKAEAKIITDEEEKNLKSEGTQTKEQSLTNCENCDFSKGSIKKLVGSVQEIFSQQHRDSRVANLRQELRPRLSEVTDWYTMNRIVEALTFDLAQLCSDKKRKIQRPVDKETKEKDTESKRKLMEIIRNLEAQLGYGPVTKYGVELQKMKNIISNLKTSLKKSEEQILIMKEEMTKSEGSKQVLENEIAILKKERAADKQCVDELEGKIVDKMKEINYLMNKYDKEIKESTNKIVNLEIKNSSLQELINSQELSIGNLEKKLKESTSREKKCKETIVKFKKSIATAREQKQDDTELRNQLKDKIDQEKKLIEKTKQLEKELKLTKDELIKTASTYERVYSPTGDTAIDLKIQKTSNENKIKLLKMQNKKLEVTLNKILNSRGENLTGKPDFCPKDIEDESTVDTNSVHSVQITVSENKYDTFYS